jgi:hypothetical protein
VTEDRSELWEPSAAGALKIIAAKASFSYKYPTATPQSDP